MDSASRPLPRVLWSFWLACGLAATGAITPLVLAAGDISRISGVAIPFGIAAGSMAVNALTYQRGRSLATALYVIAWMAVVYGILRMIAVPLEEAVVGACPAGASSCSPGFARPFASSESLAIGVGIVTGALALQVGYFGLRALYRSTRQQQPAAYASPPPQRVIAPIATASAVQSQADAPVVAEPAAVEPATDAPVVVEPAAVEPAADELPAASPAPTARPPRKPRARRSPKPAAEPAPLAGAAELPAHPESAELPAHMEQAELAAHTEQAELPAHAEPAELPPHSGDQSST